MGLNNKYKIVLEISDALYYDEETKIWLVRARNPGSAIVRPSDGYVPAQAELYIRDNLPGEWEIV